MSEFIMQQFCSTTYYSKMKSADHVYFHLSKPPQAPAKPVRVLRQKWINPGAVNKTCDPSFHISMLLLVIFCFYRTTSLTSRLRNHNCFKTAKNPGVTILDFTTLVGIVLSEYSFKKTPYALFLFQVSKIRLKRKSAKTPKNKATCSAK